MMVIFQKRHSKTDKDKSVSDNLSGNPKKKKKKSSPEVRAVTLQYSQHCCSAQIAFPRWLTPEQMLLVKVLAAMHQVQTLFSFTSTDSFLHRLPTPENLSVSLGESIMGRHYSRPECCLRICCLWCLQNPGCDCQASRRVGFGVIFHCRLFFFCLCGFDSLSLSLSFSQPFFPLLSLSFHCYIYASQCEPWRVLMSGVPVLFLEMLTNKLAPQRWLPSRD